MNTEPENIRIFIGLPVAQAMKVQYESLPQKSLQASWKHMDDLHITLRFLGDVPIGKLDDVKEMLSRIRRGPFTIVVKDMAVFTKSKRDHILYGQVESVQKITALYGEVADRMTQIGFDQPMRAFTPHMTLARAKSPDGLEDYIRKYGRGLNASWQATEFHLYQSGGVNSGQVKYKPIETYKLA